MQAPQLLVLDASLAPAYRSVPTPLPLRSSPSSHTSTRCGHTPRPFPKKGYQGFYPPLPPPQKKTLARYEGPVGSAEFQQLVEQYHAAYTQQLQELWDGQKAQHAPCRRRSMEIVQ